MILKKILEAIKRIHPVRKCREYFSNGINKEYLLLFFVLAVVIFLIYSSVAVTQAPPQEITLTTFYPAPFGEFDIVRARRIQDFDDPNNRFVDPNGESRLTALSVINGILCTVIRGTPIAGITYAINFTNGNTRLGNLTADYIHMNLPGPTDQRTGGKYVFDIAEGFSAKDCQAADVVVINSGEEVDLVKSTQRFDAGIAGVISEDPKLYMGAEKGNIPLALAGIVLCKVTTENGSIKRGDLLVSSSEPGHAMRAEPRDIKPGMLIGKALQQLEKDKGKIYILVNKQ